MSDQIMITYYNIQYDCKDCSQKKKNNKNIIRRYKNDVRFIVISSF